MRIEKSLFALSSFQVCLLSQVKYLSSITEYKSSVLESREGCSSRAPFLMECAVSLTSKNMCIYEGRYMVSSSADHNQVLSGGFQEREELRTGNNEGRPFKMEDWDE